MSSGVQRLDSAHAVTQKAGPRPGTLAQPIEPGGQIMARLVGDFIGCPLTPASLRRHRGADAVVSARVDAQHTDAQCQEAFGDGIEES